MDNEQTFEEVATYLRATHMAKVIERELIVRREIALQLLSEASEEREVWKAVGKIEVLDTLALFFAD
tara:strand:- start:392 stop:592 length:201 start_codon:yes stop_codon:yes gene_type:complete